MNSVRIGKFHFFLIGEEVHHTVHPSINQAKKESRKQGGAGWVRTLTKNPGDAELRRLLQEGRT